MSSHKEALEWAWESSFQQHYGCLRHEVLQSFDKFLSCGILAHGCARARCKSCNHSILIAYSCKRRGVCPSCAAKRALIFAENLHQNVLKAVPHRHTVFSIPKRIRAFFRYDRAQHKILFDAAWQTIKELYQAAVPDGIPAAVLTVQTAGEALNHNPHLHGIAAGGVFLPDGSFQELPHVGAEKLTELFGHKVLCGLREQGLITDTVISQILCQSHTGFSVWMGEPIAADDSNARQFVARYIDRGPIANSRIEIVDDIITYHHDSEHLPPAEFDALEFLAALSVQIPKKWEQTIRFLGYYSARTRGAQRRKQELLDDQVLLPELAPEQKRKASKTWASLIKQVYEVDPLVCPKCQGAMKIVAFIQDETEILKIMASLDIKPAKNPPPIRPPPEQEPHYEPL